MGDNNLRTAWLASRVILLAWLPTVMVAWATGWPWLIACASGRGVTVTVTGVPGQPVTLTPVAATAAGPAVHALDILPRTAPGRTTSTCSRSPPTLVSRFSEAEITPPSSLGCAEVACTPSTTPTIVIRRPATVRRAAKARQPPAGEPEPVLTPTIPSCPRLELTLYATPATGSVTCGMATIWRKTGICSARNVTRNWSLAVLTVAGSAPLGSAYRVPPSPRERAAAFIFATNAPSEPASQPASKEAMLLPEGISIASSACRSVSFSPGATWTADCPCRVSLA